MFTRLLAPLVLVTVSGIAYGQSFTPKDMAAAAELRDRAMNDNTAYELVTSLTTEVGPRAAGSPGDRAAVEWAERNLRRLGFSSVRRMDVIVPHWVRGTASFEVRSPASCFLPDVPNALAMAAVTAKRCGSVRKDPARPRHWVLSAS
mgnify:CR=1 FL=1